MNGQSNEERMEVRRRKLFSARIETIWNKLFFQKTMNSCKKKKENSIRYQLLNLTIGKCVH